MLFGQYENRLPNPTLLNNSGEEGDAIAGISATDGLSDESDELLNGGTVTISQTLERSLQTAQNLLKTFATDPDFSAKMQIAFGDTLSVEMLQAKSRNWANGDFSDIPEIEIRPTVDIRGGGAFASANNTIYLSRELLTQNAANIEAITGVLLEEIGHAADARLKAVDAPGDEGAIFSALVRGEKLDESELQRLKTKDDIALVSIDTNVVQVERAGMPVVINSLADTRPDDSYQDGIFADEFGNQSLRAVLEEADFLNIPVDITFGVQGTITFPESDLYVPSGSTITGSKTKEGIRQVIINTNRNSFRLTSNTTIQDLIVTSRISIAGDGNVVKGNYIGTDGTAVIADKSDNSRNMGVDILSGNNNIIGGTSPEDRNVISGNFDDGIFIDGSSNVVQGNFIGTDATGTIALPNDGRGISIGTSSNTSNNNLIGGTTPEARNIISGNNADGVSLVGGIGNKIQGNFIGTDVTGTKALGNGLHGVFTRHIRKSRKPCGL